MSADAGIGQDESVGHKTADLRVAQTAPTAVEAQAVFDAFKKIMDRAVQNSDIAKRLAFAQTVSHVHLRDSPQGLTMTLLFDREPIEVVEGAVSVPEVQLWIDTNDVLRFWIGDMHLAMAIAKGTVEYSGPVRKLLRVVPIARRLVSDFQHMVAAHEVASGGNGASPMPLRPN